jgi:hypothetical protein
MVRQGDMVRSLTLKVAPGISLLRRVIDCPLCALRRSDVALTGPSASSH